MRGALANAEARRDEHGDKREERGAERRQRSVRVRRASAGQLRARTSVPGFKSYQATLRTERSARRPGHRDGRCHPARDDYRLRRAVHPEDSDGTGGARQTQRFCKPTLAARVGGMPRSRDRGTERSSGVVAGGRFGRPRKSSTCGRVPGGTEGGEGRRQRVGLEARIGTDGSIRDVTNTDPSAHPQISLPRPPRRSGNGGSTRRC